MAGMLINRSHWGLLAVAAWMVTGCAGSAVLQAEKNVEQAIPSDTPENRRSVHADLIRGMIEGKQYYAAIAHIEAQVASTGTTPQLRLFEAEARRKLGQDAQAQQIYRELLKEPEYVAQAYYGLGLISASSDLAVSTWQLQQAVNRRPADADMRNDLGYVLMLSQRYQEALTELATAVELEAGSGSAKARNNLIVLMMVTGDERAVRRLAAESAMSESSLKKLRQQAQSISRSSAGRGNS